MINSIPFTATAYLALQKQHAQLKIEEKELITRVQTAREMGDLSENGAYKYGKMELGRVRRELGRIGDLLHRGQVVENPAGNKVGFGTKLVVVNQATGQRLPFQLVSQYESDPQQQKISMESPLGAAVMGKKLGDAVEVASPKGVMIYHIESISNQ